MNWEAIGAIGEVLGAIGVIVTLGYLATQVRQNSRSVRSSTRQAISTNQFQAGFQLAATPDLRAAFIRWQNGQPASNPDEALCDDMIIRATMRAFENQFHQHADGTFSDDVWAGYSEYIRRTLLSPRFPNFWATNRRLYSTSFARFIESQAPETSDDSTVV
jgi:hypothetical protein